LSLCCCRCSVKVGQVSALMKRTWWVVPVLTELRRLQLADVR
jgi:hypothetical protein